MYMFFLGAVFGFGLHAAIRSTLKTLQLRKIHRNVELEQEINRRATAKAEALYYGWNSADTSKTEALADAGRGPLGW